MPIGPTWMVYSEGFGVIVRCGMIPSREIKLFEIFDLTGPKSGVNSISPNLLEMQSIIGFG